MGARVRVTAYFMHEQEERLALEKIQDAVQTESFIIGTIDSDEIKLLERGGLVVSKFPESPIGTLLEKIDKYDTTLMSAPMMKDAVIMDAADEVEQAPSDVFSIKLAGPILEEWRESMARLGGIFLESTGSNQFVVRLDPANANKARDLDFVVSLRPYSAQKSGVEEKLLTEEMPERGYKEMKTYDIRLHDHVYLNGALEWLKENKVPVAGNGRRKIRIHLFAQSSQLSEIGRIPGVSGIEEYVPPKLFNERARVLLGIDKILPRHPVFHRLEKGKLWP